jgi:hypothetical protein
MTCPRCGAAAKCQRWQGRIVVSLFGPVRCTRHYYYCPHCRQGFCPFDHTLGLTAHDLTPAAEQLVSLAGVLDSFAEATTKVLPKMAGLRLAESTVERVTEAAGQRLAAALQAGQTFGAAKAWAWHQDAEGQTVAYVSADATGVGQQGPGGSKADGRMANVVMVYNPVPEERALGAAVGTPTGLAGAVPGDAGAADEFGGAVAAAGGAGGDGARPALDRVVGRRGRHGGLLAGELRAGGGGDLGLLPRGRALARLRQAVATR